MGFSRWKKETKMKIIRKSREILRDQGEITSKELIYQLSRNGCGNINIKPQNISGLLDLYAPEIVREGKRVNGRWVTVYKIK